MGRRRSRLATLALLLLASTSLISCARPVVFHPIEQTDIIRLEEGKQYTAPKSGWFLSDLYMEKVLQAKVR